MNRVVLFFVFFMVLLSATHSGASDYWVTKTGYIAGVTEAAFDKAVEYAVAKDERAFQQIMASGLAFPLKAGVKVYVTETKMFSGKVKIRPQGQTGEVWTNIEAIRRP